MIGPIRNTFFYQLFLELISLSPIFIILGNIVPPIPIKIHHIALGAIFLLSLLLLLKDVYKKWLIYFTLFFVIYQFLLETHHTKGIIDFFFGPFIFVLMLDIVINDRLPKKLLERHLQHFFILLWISPIISVLQYLNLLPITFWNATYINYAYFSEIAIPRPNGFLYHGSELSIIICFLALYQLFEKKQKRLLLLGIIVVIAYMTYFKALLGCILLICCFGLLFTYNKSKSNNPFFYKKLLPYGSLLCFLIALGYGGWYFTNHYQTTGMIFPKNMLTGRGAIWNIYLMGISDFEWYHYLFGNGLGSSFDLFKEYATADNWWRLAVDPNTDLEYDAHNAILSVFVHSGIVGIAFIIFLFRLLYKQVVRWMPNSTVHKESFFAVIILPLITIGVTITIYENAIYWIAISFLIWKWKFRSDEAAVEK